MGSLAFAFPIKSGKLEALKRLAQELHDDRGQHEHDRRADQGLSRLKVFLQTGQHDMMVVYLEGDDVVAAAARILRDDHDHEQWLLSKLEGIVDYAHLAEDEGVQSELVFDWHGEHGTALAEHEGSTQGPSS